MRRKGRFFPGIQEYKLRTEEGHKAGERLANLVDKLQQQVLSIFNQVFVCETGGQLQKADRGGRGDQHHQSL